MGEKHKPFKGHSKGKRRQKGKEADAAPMPKQRAEKSKADRRNSARQQQRMKRQALLMQSRQMQHVPKNVLIVPLGCGLTAESVLQQLLYALHAPTTLDTSQSDATSLSESHAAPSEFASKILASEVDQMQAKAPIRVVHGIHTFESMRFRHQKINFMLCEQDILSIVEGASVADFVLLAVQETEGMGAWGEQVQRALRAAGLPTLLPFICCTKIEGVRPAFKKAWQAYFDSAYGNKQVEVYCHTDGVSLERRIFVKGGANGAQWCQIRPHFVADSVQWYPNDLEMLGESHGENQECAGFKDPSSKSEIRSREESGVLIVSGVLRGKPLNVSRVYLSVLNDDFAIVGSKENELLDEENSSTHFNLSDVDMADEEDAQMGEFIGSDTEDGSHAEFEEMTDHENEEMTENGDYAKIAGNAGMGEIDPNLARKPLSEMYAGYQGLKSFRHGKWDVTANLPTTYKRLVQFQNLKVSERNAIQALDQKLAVASDIENPENSEISENKHGIGEHRARMSYVSEVGERVTLKLSGFNVDQQARLANLDNQTLIRVFGALKYEAKETVMHATLSRYLPGTLRSVKAEDDHAVTKSEGEEEEEEEQSEEEEDLANLSMPMLLCGYRRYSAAKLVYYEEGHGRLHRYLHKVPSSVTTFMAAFYGKVMFGAPPCLLFKEPIEGISDEARDAASSTTQKMQVTFKDEASLEWQLVGAGLLTDMNPMRVILERKTLIGHPAKIHRQSVVIRNMFHTASDVNYFKPIELVTKSGKHGHIKASIGTHGAMKCIFDKPIQQHDPIYLRLYRRIFPSL